ncbi:hypothetical protein DFQ29_001275 [Apophysomyces sp. BC1021]|nr:hypothetical protein DFQ29_001275 [Apophysomyces sp. BC1021]
MAFAILFGFFGGVIVPLSSAVIMTIVGKERFESAYSLLTLLTFWSMFGPNVADKVESVAGWSPFLSYKIITGIGYLFTALVTIGLKFNINTNPLAKI